MAVFESVPETVTTLVSDRGARRLGSYRQGKSSRFERSAEIVPPVPSIIADSATSDSPSLYAPLDFLEHDATSPFKLGRLVAAGAVTSSFQLVANTESASLVGVVPGVAGPPLGAGSLTSLLAKASESAPGWLSASTGLDDVEVLVPDSEQSRETVPSTPQAATPVVLNAEAEVQAQRELASEIVATPIPIYATNYCATDENSGSASQSKSVGAEGQSCCLGENSMSLIAGKFISAPRPAASVGSQGLTPTTRQPLQDVSNYTAAGALPRAYWGGA